MIGRGFDMVRAKVAIVHPRLGFGGSEARALWTLEALKGKYGVSLITDGDVDLPRLNECYGTNLKRTDFSILRVPLPIGLRRTTRFAALRGHFIQRFCQRVAPRFDLMISTYNPCDFGVRGIQCIADFSFDEVLRPAFDPVGPGWKAHWYRDSLLRRVYLKLCSSISRSNPEAWKKNLTLVNSNWSAKLMRQRYGLEARTLYPPVADGFPSIPYSERENGFVCIGRLVPGKHIDRVIEILSRVRRRGHDVHLHIVGGAVDSQYVRALKELCRKHRDWVFLEGAVFGERKKELIAKHRFGISGRTHEAFGIAVAEMVKAGCIVFTPNGGGQVEIVDHPDLVYSDVDDAVLKIERVLESASMQEGLRRHLSRAAQRFSVENFQRGIRDAVAKFLLEKQVGGGVAIHAEANA
jgi:glycosyltransferase involved in cell wall biosynthesis